MTGAPLFAKLGTVLALSVAGAGVGWAVADRTAPAGPAAAIGAWIDWPLDGSTIEGGVVGVLAHAADVEGVTRVELLVDDRSVAQADADDSTLVRVDLEWTPPGPGTYELRVAGFAGGERRSLSAPVRVVIGGARGAPGASTTTTRPGETTTTTVAGDTTTTAPGETTTTGVPGTTTTTRPTTTTTRPNPTTTTTRPTTTTTAPCGLVAPVPTGSTVSPLLTATLAWAYRGSCPPDTYVVQVSRTSSFARVDYAGSTSHPTVTWTTPTLSSCVTWYWRVAAVEGRTQGPWSTIGSFTTVIRGC